MDISDDRNRRTWCFTGIWSVIVFLRAVAKRSWAVEVICFVKKEGLPMHEDAHRFGDLEFKKDSCCVLIHSFSLFTT